MQTCNTPCILIVGGEVGMRDLCVRVLQPMVTVRTASDAREAMQAMQDCDVLLLEWTNADGRQSNLILDEWVSRRGGPVCVVAQDSAVSRNRLFSSGVYNVLEPPLDAGVIVILMRHYLLDVTREHDLACMKRDIARLRRYLLVMGLMLVAIGGPNLIEFAKGLLM